MANHQIKHRCTGAVLFECEVPDDVDSGLRTRHTLEKAVQARAYLADAEAMRLHLAIQDLCARNMLGENITAEDLGALLRKSAGVQYHTARTLHAATIFPPADRRDVAAVIPAMVREVCHG